MKTLMRRQTTVVYEEAVRLTSDHPVVGFLTLPSVTALLDPAGARPPKA